MKNMKVKGILDYMAIANAVNFRDCRGKCYAIECLNDVKEMERKENCCIVRKIIYKFLIDLKKEYFQARHIRNYVNQIKR